MRQIVKLAEPASLTAYRHTADCDYDGYREKDELRNRLAAEQGGLCCYCMGRIEPDWDSMKIEHWRSQSRFPADQLRYRNLLGGCLGGEGRPPRLQHCDTRKGDETLRWNPADPAHHIETRIAYASDGTIRSGDRTFDRQLNNVLNLNLPHLKNSRRGVLTGVLDWWKMEKSRHHRPPSRRRIEREINNLTHCAASYSPFCQVAVWWLRQRLPRTR